MTIDNQTAQLILDAIAWSNMEWLEAEERELSEHEQIALARQDFVRFCNARGITEVTKVVRL